MKLLALLLAALCLTELHALSSNETDHHGHTYFHGGADWDGLCKVGKQQSPIDIPVSLFSKPSSLKTDARLHGKDIEEQLELSPDLDFVGSYGDFEKAQITTHEGATIKVEVEDGTIVFIDYDDHMRIFSAHELHFHSPSEHTFNNGEKHFDMEMHLVHYDKHGIYGEKNKTYTVLSVFFDVEDGGNTTNPFIESLNLQDADLSELDYRGITKDVDLNTMISNLDKEKGLFHYKGSLTTPPCTESTDWIISFDVQPISAEQLQLFQREWAHRLEFAGGRGNNREVQAINDRKIYMHKEETDALDLFFTLSMFLVFA